MAEKPPKKIPVRKNVVVNRGVHPSRLKTTKTMTKGAEATRIGRPPRWTEVELQLVTNLCLLGLSNDDLAPHFGLVGSTIDDWMRGDVKNPEDVAPFVSALKAGRHEADAKVAGSLYARAVGYEYDEQVAVVVGKGEVVLTTVRKKLPPDVAAAFIWLKNRRRKDWKDKHDDMPEDPQVAAKVIRDAVRAAMSTVAPVAPESAEESSS